MIKITSKAVVSAVLCTFVTSTLSHADEISRLAGLSKDAFMAEYEEKFVASLEINRELIRRFNPEFVDALNIDIPMTETERAAMACSYDLSEEKGQLADLAAQIQSFETLSVMMDEDPELDFADLVMNSEVVERYTSGINTEVMSTLATCKYPQASQERLNFSPEFWASLGEAAHARGYN